MISWSKRSIEERNLFNPAYCAIVIASALKAYQKEIGEPMPFSLTLLVLPISLHAPTREKIVATNVSILRVFSQFPELVVDFAPRTRHMRRYTMEAFSVLASQGCIDVSNDGGISLRPRKVSLNPLSTEDAEKSREVARIVGRDFARINDRVTIYTTFSIRP